MAQSLSSAAEESQLLNSGARADLIRSAVRWIAEHDAEVKALNAEIREYKLKTIKGDLGFKLADWNAVYRVSQLEVEDRDALLDTVREGFEALGIGRSIDWVAAAEGEPQPEPRRSRGGSRGAAPRDEAIFQVGREDALAGHMNNALAHAAKGPKGGSRAIFAKPKGAGVTASANVKRRPVPAGASEESCDAYTSQTLAEDYRDPDRQGQDRPLISEDGQPTLGRVGLPRSRP